MRWWTPDLGAHDQVMARLAAVVHANFPNDGHVTDEFERSVAALCGTPYAVAVTSGTAALFLALAAAGIGPGDEVLVPDITFIATANAVTLAGARAVLVDVDGRTLGMDADAARAALTPRTRAIVPVHVSGRAAPMPALLDLARRHRLVVVEDAAEALGSCVGGGPLGAKGDFGCFSFSANKTITSGQGGVVVTRDASAHSRLRELKDQGRVCRGTGGDDEHRTAGYNFKLTNFQAAVAMAQWADLPQRLDHQRRLYHLYRQGFAHHPRITVLPFDIDGGEVPQWIDALVDGRDELCAAFERKGIEVRRFWHPLHSQAPYRAPADRFPVAATVAPHLLWLPSALELDDDDVARVVAAAWEWLG